MDTRMGGALLEVGRVSLRAGGPWEPAELTAEVKAFCDAVEDGPAALPTLWLDSLRSAADRAPVSGLAQVNKWEQQLRRLERLPAPIVAVLDGRCAGPALDLLLACDYRIATVGFRLQPPSHDGQLWPGLALHRLANQLAGPHVRRMLMRPGELTAHNALRMGLVDEVTDDTLGLVQDLETATDHHAGAEFAIRRALLRDARVTRYEDALGSHLAACDRELRRLAGSSGGGEQ